MALEITVKDQKLLTLFVDMANMSEDLSELLDGIGQDIQTHIDLEFKDSSDPFGVKWAALKHPRKKRKGKKRVGKESQVLTDTGILAASFSTEGADGSLFDIGDDFVRVGSDIEYAATHNFGDPKRNIPQRQIIPDGDRMPLELMEVIIERVENHFGLN